MISRCSGTPVFFGTFLVNQIKEFVLVCSYLLVCASIWAASLHLLILDISINTSMPCTGTQEKGFLQCQNMFKCYLTSSLLQRSQQQMQKMTHTRSVFTLGKWHWWLQTPYLYGGWFVCVGGSDGGKCEREQFSIISCCCAVWSFYKLLEIPGTHTNTHWGIPVGCWSITAFILFDLHSLNLLNLSMAWLVALVLVSYDRVKVLVINVVPAFPKEICK